MTDPEYVEVLRFFYPSDPPDAINNELREIAAKMTYEALQASKAMNLVPRPPSGIPSPSWLALEAVRTLWRNRKANTAIYESVRTTTALKWRSAYTLAKMGI